MCSRRQTIVNVRSHAVTVAIGIQDSLAHAIDKHLHIPGVSAGPQPYTYPRPIEGQTGRVTGNVGAPRLTGAGISHTTYSPGSRINKERVAFLVTRNPQRRRQRFLQLQRGQTGRTTTPRRTIRRICPRRHRRIQKPACVIRFFGMRRFGGNHRRDSHRPRRHQGWGNAVSRFKGLPHGQEAIACPIRDGHSARILQIHGDRVHAGRPTRSRDGSERVDSRRADLQGQRHTIRPDRRGVRCQDGHLSRHGARDVGDVGDVHGQRGGTDAGLDEGRVGIHRQHLDEGVHHVETGRRRRLDEGISHRFHLRGKLPGPQTRR